MEQELLFKYIQGNCTDQEKLVIVDWLEAKPANMKEFLTLRKLYDMTTWQMRPHKHMQKTEGRAKRLKNSFVEVLKIAAILIVVLGISYTVFLNQRTENVVAMQVLHVPPGQRAEITLEDGTKVWLNANTTLTFPNAFGDKNREVKLDGEAYFNVHHNKSKPFVVATDKYDIEVLGTEFNVQAYQGHQTFETSLFKGSVRISPLDKTTGIVIHPNEKIFLKTGQLVVAPVSDMDHFLWREGIISFDDATFSELLDKLELYFDVKIENKNKAVLDSRCTGKFRTKDGIDHILKVLQQRNEFKYTINEKRNLVIIE